MNTIQTQWKFQRKSEHFKEIKILLKSETWDKMYKCLTIVTKCEPETLVKGGAILLSQSWRLGEELSILCYDHSASHLNTVFILLSYITHASWTTLLRTGRRTEWLICYHLENQDYYKQLISEKNQHSKEVSWCFGPFFVGRFFFQLS